MDRKEKLSGDLSSRELEEIEKRSTIRAVVVHEAIRMEGEAELERPTAALAWSGLAAGLSMGFSLVGEGLLRSHLPDAPWTPLIAKFGYSLGFLIVILGRQQLFTENTILAVIPFLMCWKMDCLKNVVRLWTVVLVTNLVGVFIFVVVIGNTEIFSPGERAAFTQIGQSAMRPDFLTVMLKGIFAGWLIALIVWLMPVVETARVMIIVIITYAVGLGELSHIIAGSAETLYLVVTEQTGFGDFLVHYMLPTLIGNSIGGVSLAAALNHAQVIAGGNLHQE